MYERTMCSLTRLKVKILLKINHIIHIRMVMIVIINIIIDWALKSNCIALGHWAFVICLVVEFQRCHFNETKPQGDSSQLAPFQILCVAFLICVESILSARQLTLNQSLFFDTKRGVHCTVGFRVSLFRFDLGSHSNGYSESGR